MIVYEHGASGKTLSEPEARRVEGDATFEGQQRFLETAASWPASEGSDGLRFWRCGSSRRLPEREDDMPTTQNFNVVLVHGGFVDGDRKTRQPRDLCLEAGGRRGDHRRRGKGWVRLVPKRPL